MVTSSELIETCKVIDIFAETNGNYHEAVRMINPDHPIDRHYFKTVSDKIL